MKVIANMPNFQFAIIEKDTVPFKLDILLIIFTRTVYYVFMWILV